VRLQQAISQELRIFFLASTCWCVDVFISCIIWWNLRQWIIIKNFSFVNQNQI